MILDCIVKRYSFSRFQLLTKSLTGDKYFTSITLNNIKSPFTLRQGKMKTQLYFYGYTHRRH